MSDLPKFEPLPNVGNVVSNRVTAFNQGYNLYQCINYLQGYVSIVYENMDALLDDWNNFQQVMNENIPKIANEETQRILNQWLEDGTLNDLIAQNPLWNQKLDKSGGTMTGNIKFSENTKIVGTTPGGNDIDLIHNTNDGASGNYVQFGDPDAKSVFNSSTRPVWHDGSDDFILLTSGDIVDNLTTTNNTKALSASQGKNLQDNKLNKTDVINNLISTSTTKALSAAQGKELQENKLDVTDVINNLTSSSTRQALSAAQGKALNDKLVGIFSKITKIAYVTKVFKISSPSGFQNLYNESDLKEILGLSGTIEKFNEKIFAYCMNGDWPANNAYFSATMYNPGNKYFMTRVDNASVGSCRINLLIVYSKEGEKS